MDRRHFLAIALTALGAGVGGIGLGLGGNGWLGRRLYNPCLPPAPLPPGVLPLVAAAWEGLDPARYLDGHIHLAGVGEGGSGIRVHPDFTTPWHPIPYLAAMAYHDGACAPASRSGDPPLDERYARRLAALLEGLPPGARGLVLAMDRAHDAGGEPLGERTAVQVPDEWVAAVAGRWPERLWWAASIHPYRADCEAALERAVAAGARAVKWLPPVQGIDPASPLCDRFYGAMARWNLPLIGHGGEERAVAGGVGEPGFADPRRYQRALAAGVRVVVAHCATLGRDGDGVGWFQRFAGMMGEKRWEGRLYGDLSAVTLRNREPEVLRELLVRREWHHRLIQGSDYPLPGVVPFVDLEGLAGAGLLAEGAVEPLGLLRGHNPLLFDFVLKRHLRWQGAAWPPEPFQAAGVFG